MNYVEFSFSNNRKQKVFFFFFDIHIINISKKFFKNEIFQRHDLFNILITVFKHFQVRVTPRKQMNPRKGSLENRHKRKMVPSPA